MPHYTPAGRSFALTLPMVAAHAGATGLVCLDMRAEGSRYRLHADRPGAALNRAVRRAAAVDGQRADLPSGAAHNIIEIEPHDAPALIRVDISGPLEERAGYYDECGGWSDGHDAVCERLCAAFEMGDVLLVVDSPGGAAAGLQQQVARAAAAKARTGRRVTVYVNETCCSAAIWWAFGVGDEIFGPAMAQIGSIGARGAHESIAGALAREGIAIEYFVWPSMGKVALAPELPLSDEGRARGIRDITILGEAFAAAVVSSSMGQRFGLTVESIASLSADVFTGAYALTCPDPVTGAARARLLDGVETLETVTEYALALAESTEARAITDQAEAAGASAQGGAASAQGERAMSLQTDAGAAAPNARAEGDEPDDDEGGAAAAGPGTVPDGECAGCGSANDVSHKFCAQCGASMAASPIEPEPADDEAPPSSEAPPMAAAPSPAAPMAKRAALPPAPKAMDASASLASILGATAESPLAIKTAAIALRLDRDRLHAAAVGLTGKTSTDGAIGAMLALPAALASGKQAAADLAATRAAADKATRSALLKRGIASGHAEMSRGRVWIDAPEGGGKKTLARRFAEMKTETLQEYVEGLEATATRRNPFVPDEAEAKRVAEENKPTQGDLDAAGNPTPAAIARAVKDPAVIRMHAGQTGSTKQTIEKVAELHIRAAVKAGMPNRTGGAQ